jgi:predicted unusual protein kinase regulating ubiquinone biosynthesis (AarF/ABC1/UbiB family)
MQVNSSGQMQQTQMRKMDGSGVGQGQSGGMKEIMQSMSSEDRTAFREQIAALSEVDRKTIKEQMSKIDISTLSSETLAQTLTDMLSSLQSSSITEASSTTTIDLLA